MTAEPPDQLSYAQALAELDAILERLEHQDPDVDQVATDVERAAALVGQLKGRIATTRLQVDQVMAELDPPADPGRTATA